MCHSSPAVCTYGLHLNSTTTKDRRQHPAFFCLMDGADLFTSVFMMADRLSLSLKSFCCFALGQQQKRVPNLKVDH